MSTAAVHLIPIFETERVMNSLTQYKSIAVAAIIALVLGLTGANSCEAQTPVEGAILYKSKCAACHSLASNKIGPAHKGVYGRKAGSAPGYVYSDALKKSGIVWTDANLDRWLQGPQNMVKGSKMFLAVPDPAQRKAIIAYLKSSEAK